MIASNGNLIVIKTQETVNTNKAQSIIRKLRGDVTGDKNRGPMAAVTRDAGMSASWSVSGAKQLTAVQQ